MPQTDTGKGPGFPSYLSALLSPGAFAHPVTAVHLVETHISWVLLTGEFAYKIKRPVCYPFVDLRTPERRAYLCAEEVRLNRRFAPELYVGVVPITVVDGQARMGGEGEAVEHAVCMRQFARESELDRLLAAQGITPDELAAFGRSLAEIHETLPRVDRGQPYGTAAAVRASLLENVEQCMHLSARVGAAGGLHGLRPLVEKRMQSVHALVDARRDAGRVRECHGDLHSRNVVRHAGRLVAFDCLEFEPAFRWVDVAEEISFLLMDLLARGNRAHATAFLNGYLTQSGDVEACRLIRLYGAHRALVRAKVAALEVAGAAEPKRREASLAEHHMYVRCARQLLEPSHPSLVLMSGLSGSGKTWLARQLAPLVGAVHLRSDVERKRMGGVPELASSGSGLQSGLYSADMTGQLYEQLAHRAEDALSGGFSVIVDATFQRKADRALFAALAARLHLPTRLILCRAPNALLESRVVSRARAGGDASEASLSVLSWQRSHFEPPTPGEGLTLIEADTTRPDVVPQVRAALGSF